MQSVLPAGRRCLGDGSEPLVGTDLAPCCRRTRPHDGDGVGREVVVPSASPAGATSDTRGRWNTGERNAVMTHTREEHRQAASQSVFALVSGVQRR